jgi:phosphoribosyl 1,2-cyclic phosphodiesterase
MQERLESVGYSWNHIGAAILTHTHGDHVCDSSLRELARRSIPLFCHEGHTKALSRMRAYPALEQAGLVRYYDQRPFLTSAGLHVEPLPMSHDGGATFGFRIEGKPGRRLPSLAVGFLSDTGTWKDSLADALADVDVLGVEFNHDVDLQRRSGRHPVLIARNLGHRGHLSNDQAADFIAATINRSRQRRVRHVVLLHLSEQCNHPDLALHAARLATRRQGCRAAIHVASQDAASPNLRIQPGTRRRSPAPAMPALAAFPWEPA